MFDPEYYPLDRGTIYTSRRLPRSSFLKIAIMSTQSVVRVRYMTLVINVYQIEPLLICECLRLDRVIIQLVNPIDFAWLALDIEQELRLLRSVVV
jgi:hypothetical protein